MPVDTSIYGQFAEPARSTADYAAQYDAADARRMALQQNALALQSGRQKAEEYTRGVNEQGMLRNALAQLPQGATDEQRIQTMRGTNLPIGYTQADALQKTLIERDKGQAEARAKQAEVLGKVLTAQGELATRVIANPTRESAMAAVANMRAITQALGVPVDLTQDEQQIAQMSDPAQITRWAQGHALKATDFLAKLQQVNNGKTTSFVDVNSVSNPGGPAPITMTTTPGEDSSAATQRRGQDIGAATAAAGRVQSADQFNRRLAYDQGKDAAKAEAPPKPLPPAALKMQQESLDAIGISSSINADLGGIANQIESKKLAFGPIKNMVGAGLNAAGMSTENSRNFASFKSTLERLRNESLRLNAGVQTDGDAQRAWNELFQNINDTDLVKQRLAEIQNINKRGAELHQLRVDSVRSNYGAGPLDASAYKAQPAAVGAPKPGAPQAGAVMDGYRFKGGNPADKANWEKQ